jgi:septum formation protein
MGTSRMKKDILYLGSKSQSRRKLLQESGIPFLIINHNSNEVVGISSSHFHKHVLEIACHKMNCLLLPTKTETNLDYLFVITADSLSRSTKSNQIFGKPKNIADAKRMLKIKQNESIEVATGCCLEKKIFVNEQWETQNKKHWITTSEIEFFVPDDEQSIYLKKTPAALLSCGGAIAEHFGINFFKSIKGSYSAMLGLPIFELRQELKVFGFSF